MYQKCPLCNGLGMTPEPFGLSNQSTALCTVCKGSKIISELTGQPPVVLKEEVKPYAAAVKKYLSEKG